MNDWRYPVRSRKERREMWDKLIIENELQENRNANYKKKLRYKLVDLIRRIMLGI